MKHFVRGTKRPEKIEPVLRRIERMKNVCERGRDGGLLITALTYVTHFNLVFYLSIHLPSTLQIYLPFNLLSLCYFGCECQFILFPTWIVTAAIHHRQSHYWLLLLLLSMSDELMYSLCCPRGKYHIVRILIYFIIKLIFRRRHFSRSKLCT